MRRMCVETRACDRFVKGRLKPTLIANLDYLYGAKPSRLCRVAWSTGDRVDGVLRYAEYTSDFVRVPGRNLSGRDDTCVSTILTTRVCIRKCGTTGR